MVRKEFLAAVSLSALAGSLAAQAPAYAQSGAGENAQMQPVIEEILVTARRREENVQDIPVAISVLDSDQLQSTYSNSLEGVQFSVPSLSFRKGNTTRNSALFLRGIGTISFSTSAEPSVSTVIDGVVLARSGMAFKDLLDIQRLEVLRGPQGTLFGKNASAGVLNITTVKPGQEFAGEVTFTGFEDDEWRLNAAVDIPITERLRTRLTGFFGWFDGYVTNLFAGGKLNNLNDAEVVEAGAPIDTAADEQINGYETQGFRGIVEFDPLDNLRLTLIGDYSDANDDCCAEILGEGPTDPFLAPSILDALGNAVPRGNETRTVNQNLVTTTLDTNWGLSLQGELDIAGHTITSITAYRQWMNTEIREGDFLPGTLNVIRGPEIGEDGLFTGETVRKGGLFELHDLGPQDWDSFQQEIRIASTGRQTVDYQAGLFYFNVQSDRSFTRFDRICLDSELGPVNSRTVTDAAGNTGTDLLLPCLASASEIVAPSATANFSTEFDNIAVFGNATWNITDAFRVTGGIRWTHDEVSFEHMRVNTTGELTAPGVRAGSFQASNETDNSEVTGEAAVQYDITPDLMVYAKYARGYKGPAFNTFFNMSEADVPPIGEETANSYEGGVKSTWFGGRLRLNATGFYAKYDGFQANNFEVLNDVVVTRLTNAGSVETSGLELDFSARPIERLEIYGGLAITDAQIDAFNVPRGAPPSATDRSGDPLPLSPDVKVSLAADYVTPLDGLPIDIYWHTDFSYTDEQFSDLDNTPDLLIDSFALWNANVGIADKDDRYRLTFIVKNITDESFSSLQTGGGPGGSIRFQIPREAERYVGLSFRVRFN